jgi:hypothetical protein
MRRLFILCEYIKVLSGGLRRFARQRIKTVRRVTSWNLAIAGSSKLNAFDQLTRATRVNSAVEMLADCRGGADEWRNVFEAINMIEAFGKLRVIKSGARELVAEAQSMSVAAMDRQRATRSNVLRPVEVEALRSVSDAWAALLDVVSCNEYFRAEEMVKRKVKQALSRGSHGNVRVLEAA